MHPDCLNGIDEARGNEEKKNLEDKLKRTRHLINSVDSLSKDIEESLFIDLTKHSFKYTDNIEDYRLINKAETLNQHLSTLVKRLEIIRGKI